jgi:hypothetical protein
MSELNRSKSEELFKVAKTYFPGGVNSPVRAFKSVGGTPLFIKKGDGPYLWDEDDNKFIDFLGFSKDNIPYILKHKLKNIYGFQFHPEITINNINNIINTYKINIDNDIISNITLDI